MRTLYARVHLLHLEKGCLALKVSANNTANRILSGWVLHLEANRDAHCPRRFFVRPLPLPFPRQPFDSEQGYLYTAIDIGPSKYIEQGAGPCRYADLDSADHARLRTLVVTKWEAAGNAGWERKDFEGEQSLTVCGVVLP